MQYLNYVQFLPHFLLGACPAVDYSVFFNVVNLNKWSIIHGIGYLLINKKEEIQECRMFTFLLVYWILKAYSSTPTDVSHQWVGQFCSIPSFPETFQHHENNHSHIHAPRTVSTITMMIRIIPKTSPITLRFLAVLDAFWAAAPWPRASKSCACGGRTRYFSAHTSRYMFRDQVWSNRFACRIENCKKNPK